MSNGTPDTRALEKDLELTMGLYKQLEPILQRLHEKYPESKQEFMREMDKSDGFCRLIDLVPNMQHTLMCVVDMPEMELAHPMRTKAAQTQEIFAQSRAMLETYAHDPLVRDSMALSMHDLLEDLLLGAYETADALHAPATQGLSDISEAQRLLAERKGRTPGGN